MGLLDATAINVGDTIGAGIFVAIGIVAGMAGPALLISIMIAAVVSLFTALSFSELTAWLPREGSVYQFSCRLISLLAGSYRSHYIIFMRVQRANIDMLSWAKSGIVANP